MIVFFDKNIPFTPNFDSPLVGILLRTYHGARFCAVCKQLLRGRAIADQAAFQQAVAETIQLAQQGLVTFGIQPDARKSAMAISNPRATACYAL